MRDHRDQPGTRRVLNKYGKGFLVIMGFGAVALSIAAWYTRATSPETWTDGLGAVAAFVVIFVVVMASGGPLVYDYEKNS